MVLSLARQLRTRNYHSTICCIENRGELALEAEHSGISVHALDLEEHGKWQTFLTMRRWLSAQPRPVILHSHNFKPFYYASLARICKAADGHVHTRHGAFIRHHRATWRYRLLRSGTNRIITVSEDGRQELARMSGLSLEQIGTISNGIDTDTFIPATDRGALRKSLNLLMETQAIIVVARLAPEKILEHCYMLFASFTLNYQIPNFGLSETAPKKAR